MSVKNLMEDIVSALVEEVISKAGKEEANTYTDIYKDDIITYVLNRIPPKYYTSERGILHGKLESQFVFQQKTDILLLVHEAINVIKKRRASELSAGLKESEMKYFLPHIMGEVLEETTFSIIPNVQVTLLYKDKPAEMMDQIWKNPYNTNKATKGFFHFLPRLPKAEIEKANSKMMFELVCSHAKFAEKRLKFELSALDEQNLYKSFIMPMILLQKLEGVDLSFLSE